MRNLIKQRQAVWFCQVEEVNDGLDRYSKLSKPEKHLMTVGWATGEMNWLNSGVETDYDRQLTSYERNFHPEEGWRVFIDVVPALDEEGNLAVDEQGDYITLPDYWVYKMIDTNRSINSRIAVKKV